MRNRRYRCISLVVAIALFLTVSNHAIPVRASERNPDGMSVTQRNSLAMLNYLTVLTQEISVSRNSRLYLEEAYSSLINNISPNAVDSSTLAQITGLLDTLEEYRMISLKREQLRYIYEQECAKAIRSLLPQSLNVLNVVQSRSLPTIAFTIADLAINSAANYTNYTEEANLTHLKGGWALDESEYSVLHNSRKQTFAYMVSIVNEQSLPGELALNENYVKEFVDAKNNSNVIQQIQFLESNQNTYRAFGEYWLTLADCYYKNGDLTACLEAITAYQQLETRIFRKDYRLAKTLPLAIVAAKDSLGEAEYIALAEGFSRAILENTDNADWSLRYFVAQAYVDFFGRTNEPRFLKASYEITLDNVNYLVNKQKEMNQKYLMDLVLAPVPKDASNAVKADIDNYNKHLREERKVTVPPIYEPLLLNCDLLFMLARELKIDEAEKLKIDGILHENGAGLFLIPAVDAAYWFNAPKATGENEDVTVKFRGSELSIPADMISSSPEIRVSVSNPEDTQPMTYSDWQISTVERVNKGDPKSFVAIFQSENAKQHEYHEGTQVEIEVLPRQGIEREPYRFVFSAKQNKTEWWEAVKLWEDGFLFERVE